MTHGGAVLRRRRYLYATIDVAALQYRIRQGYAHIVYVTDLSQAHHFAQLFQVRALTSSGCRACDCRVTWLCVVCCAQLPRRLRWRRGVADIMPKDAASSHATGSVGDADAVALYHAGFGMVLGADNKKLSSRDGVDMTLSSLLEQGLEVGCAPVSCFMMRSLIAARCLFV